MKVLDEYKLSAPINIWEPIIYGNKHEIIVDVYYIANGFPKEIHDRFGAEEVNSFRFDFIEEIKKRNNCDDVWRILADAFAVLHKNTNIMEFEFEYNSLKYLIKRKTIKVQLFENTKPTL